MPLLCDINGISANNFYVFGKKVKKICGKKFLWVKSEVNKFFYLCGWFKTKNGFRQKPKSV
jgi:hypothetical protein